MKGVISTPTNATNNGGTKVTGNVYFSGTSGTSFLTDYSNGEVNAQAQAVAPKGSLVLDSTRFSNLKYVPNLKIGYWQCDIEGDDVASGYIKQTVDGSTTTITNLSAKVGCAYNNGLNYQNKLCAEGTKKLTISAYTITLRGKRQNNNYYNITINANYVNKTELRTAYNAAILAAYNSADYSTTAFNAYSSALMNAGTVLGNPSATSNDISSAYSLLTNAVANMG